MKDGGSKTTPRLEGRNGSVWRQVTIYRRTYEDVAEEFGISMQRVGQIIAEVKASIPEHDLDTMRQESLDLYAELGRRAMEIADLVPAPVVVGKNNEVLTEFDPVTGEEKVVRDYSGRIKALETAAKMDLERRKLMGLDAPSKTEVAGAVRYEIVGVDIADLT